MNMFMNYYREYIALTGGSSVGNYMHLQKTIGVLKALAEKDGLTYSEDVEKLAYTWKMCRGVWKKINRDFEKELGRLIWFSPFSSYKILFYVKKRKILFTF